MNIQLSTATINIGLVLLSAILALFLPLELFLFSYAVLGPLHYLTEIHWLHQKQYFAARKIDGLLILLTTLPLLLSGIGILFLPPSFALLSIIWSFLWTGILTTIKKWKMRILAGIGALILSLIIVQLPFSAILFGVFLPTIIHVFIFTGLFMVWGALKRNTTMEYLHIAIFLCAAIAMIIFPIITPLQATPYLLDAFSPFTTVHTELMNVFHFSIPVDGLFTTDGAIRVMRFLAFAYTYHYLNWFSKTSIIKWHTASMPILFLILISWLFAIVLYTYDYAIGLSVLFVLSFLHVFLEFPLNWKSFIEIPQLLFKRKKSLP